ncbi:MAG: FecR domain-containing protein [Ginsengibacter sp.]
MEGEKFTQIGLLKRFLDNTITTAEAEELFAWLRTTSFEDDSDVAQIMDAYYQNSFAETATPDLQTNREHLDKLLKTINADEKKQVTPVIRMNKKWWMAAASIIILLGVGSFFIYLNNSQPPIEITKTLLNDIAPGGNVATLTLSDGSTISLDSANNGSLAQQGQSTIIKLEDGQLAYEENAHNTVLKEVQYNTVSTPRGGQYQLVLADGSKVWLNAASSIRFPAAFTGKERNVEITGEVYFEVAHNATKPFIVKANEVDIKVLGTSFNVNAYKDENLMKTTLLEGSVEVLMGKEKRFLKPGEQAVVNNNGQFQLKSAPDLESVVAWKDGKFDFRDLDLKSIMRQMERWYGVEVIYKGDIPKEEFVGIISRDVNLSEIIKMLETAGSSKFELNQKTVIVKN